MPASGKGFCASVKIIYVVVSSLVASQDITVKLQTHNIDTKFGLRKERERLCRLRGAFSSPYRCVTQISVNTYRPGTAKYNVDQEK